MSGDHVAKYDTDTGRRLPDDPPPPADRPTCNGFTTNDPPADELLRRVAEQAGAKANPGS